MASQEHREGSVWGTVKAVAWSFFGVRRSSDFQKDVGQLKPYHIIVVGVAACVLFVVILIAVVTWAVPH
jgi:hypothetical protein